jgi:hypothetical protein
VEVTIEEPGEHHLALEVDDIGLGAYVAFHSLVGPYVSDLAVFDGYRLGPASRRIDRVNSTVLEHPVRSPGFITRIS